jgi:hypothetical protein
MNEFFVCVVIHVDKVVNYGYVLQIYSKQLTISEGGKIACGGKRLPAVYLPV